MTTKNETSSLLALNARSQDDMEIISALLQDSISRITNISWQKKKYRFSMFVYRFRWELLPIGKRGSISFSRVNTVLIFDGVLQVSSLGIKNALANDVLSLLRMDLKSYKDFDEIKLTFSGNIFIKLRVEFLDIRLKDLQSLNNSAVSNIPKHEN